MSFKAGSLLRYACLLGLHSTFWFTTLYSYHVGIILISNIQLISNHWSGVEDDLSKQISQLSIRRIITDYRGFSANLR